MSVVGADMMTATGLIAVLGLMIAAGLRALASANEPRLVPVPVRSRRRRPQR
ncbi:hypothetical protein [Rhodoplanes elegans]|uniref:hypothetical protein n=1 Tax=Rhodoplanes elegans TaxID=29408 RepID=UPI0014738472|nr:hypothetical protein [Rhodoplanes elegans]